jgi:hypothetical protein
MNQRCRSQDWDYARHNEHHGGDGAEIDAGEKTTTTDDGNAQRPTHRGEDSIAFVMDRERYSSGFIRGNPRESAAKDFPRMAH